MGAHRFPYDWRLADGYPAAGIEPHGCTVFGTFVCGGGSTMGYKLAGFRHLGGVEIDPRAAEVYRANHAPEMLFVEDLRAFNARAALPSELYDLDVLDGSPPCSTFSMAGSRENAWGKEKRFREGQAKQTLDDLVFVYCETVEKLRPRVFLMENVAGLTRGNASAYCFRIFRRLTEAGYRIQAFSLNAANMGVPQSRQRTFFIGLRDDLAQSLPRLNPCVSEPTIPFGDVCDDADTAPNLCPSVAALWAKRRSGDLNLADVCKRERGRDSFFNYALALRDRVCPTVCANNCITRFDLPRSLNARELLRVSSFPSDYKAPANVMPFYCGMSVPPVMMAHVASAIYEQWLKPLKEGNPKT